MLDALERPSSVQSRSDDWTRGTQLSSALMSQVEQQALIDARQLDRTTGMHANLIIAGERVENIFVVRQGWAVRYKVRPDGKRQIIGVLLPGDVVNIDALSCARAGYCVRSVGKAEFVPIRCGQMKDLAERHPGIRKMLMRLALLEISIRNQWMLVLGAASADERIAHLLCELSVRLAGNNEGLGRFELPLTQLDIGDAVGLTGIHVSRMISSLRNSGLLLREKRTAILPDTTLLRRLADFRPDYLQVG